MFYFQCCAYHWLPFLWNGTQNSFDPNASTWFLSSGMFSFKIPVKILLSKQNIVNCYQILVILSFVAEDVWEPIPSLSVDLCPVLQSLVRAILAVACLLEHRISAMHFPFGMFWRSIIVPLVWFVRRELGRDNNSIGRFEIALGLLIQNCTRWIVFELGLKLVFQHTFAGKSNMLWKKTSSLDDSALSLYYNNDSMSSFFWNCQYTWRV